jgi:hypothetical protein
MCLFKFIKVIFTGTVVKIMFKDKAVPQHTKERAGGEET